MKESLITIPSEWTLFTIFKETPWQEDYHLNFHADLPLLYEAAYIHKIKTIKPWLNNDETIISIIQEWNTLKSELHEKFLNRDKIAIVPLMKKGMGLLIEIIYWTNELPALINLQEIGDLEVKPVNLKERLEYILSYPDKFHSYVQIGELFSEMEKLFKKTQAIKKRG